MFRITDKVCILVIFDDNFVYILHKNLCFACSEVILMSTYKIDFNEELTKIIFQLSSNMSLVVRKPVFGVSDQIRHKPGCTTTEDG